ncbi:hypothetical protein L596_013761 [Steinernema carpocapsae]|uniref:Secreted protein n=1 Tax=Steinernema carpocapsae TaxID=34508 RepID=A0A4U5P147_STECR|nr:hypothetical protein L596_013761 [Steinernema carpocapsae]
MNAFKVLLKLLVILASISQFLSFPITSTTTAVYCAPFCDDGDFDQMVFPDYADVEPETGSNVGNEYH